MAQQTLRDLAREYAKGNLSRESYLRSRTELLEGILAGEVRVAAIDFPPPISRPVAEPSDATLPRNRKRQAAEPTTQDVTAIVSPEERKAAARALAENKAAEPVRGSGGKAPVLLIVAALVIVVIVAAVYVLAPGDEQPAGGESAAAPASSTNDGAVASADPAPATLAPPVVEASPQAAEAGGDNAAGAMVREFIAQKDWSPENLARFVEGWQGLPVEDREAAVTDGVEMSQLANEVYKRLLAVRALASIDGPQASYDKQKVLVDFSRDVGIRDDRLTLPDPPAPATAK